jgi:DNA-binding NarL/FixJ family response regulator
MGGGLGMGPDAVASHRWTRRVVVIDDNVYAREGLRRMLDEHDDIDVVHSMSHDDAVSWTDEQFGHFDCAVVEVIDELARNEAGTDLFSGIAALERLRRLPVRTYAVTPHRHHPVVEQRIYQSGADYIYRQFEINDVEWFVSQLISPDETHRVQPVPEAELRSYGAARARTNDAVREFERSVLHRRLRSTDSHSGLRRSGVQRRALDGFVEGIRRTGFATPEGRASGFNSARAPRFPDVKLYLLTLLGRVPETPTNVDDPPDNRW